MKKLKVRASSFQKKLMLSYVIIILIPVLSALLIFGLDYYNQTKKSYEDIMNQLNKRTSLVVTDFFSNISRNSYFYLTDNRLKRILEKKTRLNSLEFIDDSNYMQQAMDQILLMNGQLVGITISDLNGRVYSSTGANTGYLYPLLDEMPKEKLQEGKVFISNVYDSKFTNNQGKVVSIIRYLSDLDGVKERDVYAKLDIKFKLIENLFGGVSESNSEVGTIVTAGDKLIYNSVKLAFDAQEIKQILSYFEQRESQVNELVQLMINGEKYMFTETLNEQTGWSIIQYVPSRIIDNAFKKNVSKYVVISLLCLLTACIMAILYSRRFFKPIYNLIKMMKIVDSGSLDQMVDEKRNDEIGKLVQSYNLMISRLKESREKEILSNQLQKQAELNMLQAQINPHFLYNTLNTINSIAELHRIVPISVMTKSLSNMYRYNVKSKNHVTIQSELEQIKNYIHIQQIRFLNKFEIIYDIDENVLKYSIMKFLLQPIIENSFYHGLEPKGGKGTLLLSIKKQGHTLHIKVQDDGIGISEDRLKEIHRSILHPTWTVQQESRNHIGLQNVNARINNHYGEEYWLRITGKLHEGTCVQMLIPAQLEA
ncbi:two-component system, sensor histidine kinase YesM [Paenibacillus sp. 1_12]|uniref:sensor histidine kinase n=1 Tax=Paenibacillus sp. 1_12 TaxID=1566278 RepID=UPI0008ED601F|nr:histidine kinase [Paenibacillus sp. 1_12]SFM43559.1 two-component system, sensor histidine kinase YesM [Paenibacillus sp. 1_12]